MFDVVRPVVNDFVNSVGTFPVRAQDAGALYLCIMKHSSEYKASDGEGSPFDLGVVVSLDFAFLRGEAIARSCPLFVD